MPEWITWVFDGIGSTIFSLIIEEQTYFSLCYTPEIFVRKQV